MNTPKKHKKHNTNKLEDSKQLKSQDQELKHNSVILRNYVKFPLKKFWSIVLVISVLLNIWLSYLVLSPKVTIDYAPHLLPNSPTDLPIVITNSGLLPIYKVKCIFEDALSVGKKPPDVFKFENNVYKVKISDKLTSGQSTNYIYGFYTVPYETTKGSINITLKYELPILTKEFSTQVRFNAYNSKDGYVRWMKASIPLP
ncbi:MAG: hypothetical protein ABSF13_10525 [Smithella sp.]